MWEVILGFVIIIAILYALSRGGIDKSGGIGEKPKTPPPTGRGAGE